LKVLFSDEARLQLLACCKEYERDQPVAFIHWQAPTIDVRRADDGTSLVERVPGIGHVEIIPGYGRVPATSIETMQGIPVLVDFLPEDESGQLYVSFSAGIFSVNKHGA